MFYLVTDCRLFLFEPYLKKLRALTHTCTYTPRIPGSFGCSASFDKLEDLQLLASYPVSKSAGTKCAGPLWKHVHGRLQSLSLCISSHFICLTYITAQSWGPWPLFGMMPVYWEGEEIGPLNHRKRTTLSQPWVFLSSRDEVGAGSWACTSALCLPLECGCSLLGKLLGLQMSRRTESKLSASQALLKRSLDPHRSGVLARCLRMRLLCNPAKAICWATVPTLMPVFLILSSGIMEWKRDNQEENKKEGRKGGKTERQFLDGEFYMLHPIWSQVPVHEDF